MAMWYVPNDKKDEIRRKICEDCKHNNREEHLTCCWCQEGSMFEEKTKQKLPRGNRKKLPIIEQKQSDCSPELKWNCGMNCKKYICRNCDKRFDCDGGNPVMGCGE